MYFPIKLFFFLCIGTTHFFFLAQSNRINKSIKLNKGNTGSDSPPWYTNSLYWFRNTAITLRRRFIPPKCILIVWKGKKSVKVPSFLLKRKDHTNPHLIIDFKNITNIEAEDVYGYVLNNLLGEAYGFKVHRKAFFYRCLVSFFFFFF